MTRFHTTFIAAALVLAAHLGRPLPAAAEQSPAQGAAPAAAPIDYDAARLDRRLPAARATGAITIDGTLDEPAWAGAPMARDFIQNDPREGAPATFDTEVRVLYDDDALYFGVFAKDDEPARIIVSDIKKDFDTSSSDGFRIILDTFYDQRNGYQFATNPAGAKWDAQMSNEGRENNASWDGIWDVATRIADAGWYAEVRIPLRTLKFTSGDAQTWGLNFERKVRRLNEDSYWSPVPRIYDIQRVSLAGSVEDLRGLRPGLNLRVKPYATSSSNTLAGRPTNGDFDVGLDAKYGVTTGLVWDFTANTDFSQVEADEQQINLSRFSLFFPEKRDFFLENSGIFQFGGGGGSGMGGGGGGGGGGGIGSPRQNASQEMRLFFSRQIGLSADGNAIPILAGTRLTGRQGAYSVGLLNIQQREITAVPATNFSAFRVRRDILANSDIGAIVLNKEVTGTHFNRVAGAEANFRFGPYFTTNGFIARTFSPAGATPAAGNDYSSRATARYSSRTWTFMGRMEGIGARFNDEMGFIPRQGVNNMYLFGSRRFRPGFLSRWVRETQPHWQVDAFARQSGGGLESRYQDFHWPVAFQDGSSMEVGINPNVEIVRQPFMINSSRRISVNPGRYEFKEYFVLWRANNAALFSFDARYTTGRFYDGDRRGYAFGPVVRLNENFNAALALQLNDIELSTGAFVSKLLTARVNYNFNTKMFFNALVQYNNDNRQWTSNLRFNIIHRPLSDFFLVYNERRDERSGQLLTRAVIAKVTYMMAF